MRASRCFCIASHQRCSRIDLQRATSISSRKSHPRVSSLFISPACSLGHFRFSAYFTDILWRCFFSQTWTKSADPTQPELAQFNDDDPIVTFKLPDAQSFTRLSESHLLDNDIRELNQAPQLLQNFRDYLKRKRHAQNLVSPLFFFGPSELPCPRKCMSTCCDRSRIHSAPASRRLPSRRRPARSTACQKMSLSTTSLSLT